MLVTILSLVVVAATFGFYAWRFSGEAKRLLKRYGKIVDIDVAEAEARAAVEKAQAEQQAVDAARAVARAQQQEQHQQRLDGQTRVATEAVERL